MPSADGPQGPDNEERQQPPPAPAQSVELQLFESLIHHLVEKGVLTKNDALSVVQTVAEVKQGQREAGESPPVAVRTELALLERLYSSFELMRSGPSAPTAVGSDNVLQLRPPLHGDRPKFPKDD